MIDKSVLEVMKLKLNSMSEGHSFSKTQIECIAYLAREIIELEIIIEDYEQSKRIFISDCGGEEFVDPIIKSECIGCKHVGSNNPFNSCIYCCHGGVMSTVTNRFEKAVLNE